MPDWLIIADDLTGANDSGVMFAQRGLDTLCALSPGPLPPAQAWVISSASRQLCPPEAAQATRAALRQAFAGLAPGEQPRIYKKMDSALRGSPAAELGALLETCAARRALICPALPAQERAVRGGRVYWRGLPIEQSEFGALIPNGDLQTLFAPLAAQTPLHSLALETVRGGVEAVCAALRGAAHGVWIADAETSADLSTLARAAELAPVEVLCGAAGLAQAAAGTAPTLPAPPPTGQQPWLAVLGSRSPTAAAQVQQAVRSGAGLFEPGPAELESALSGTWAAPDLDRKRDWVLSLGHLGEDARRGPRFLAGLAAIAAVLARAERPGGLFLSGGDSAAAVCAALGTRLLRLGGEVEPGMVWGRCADGLFTGLAVITKAGSFGQPDSLARALNCVRPQG